MSSKPLPVAPAREAQETCSDPCEAKKSSSASTETGRSKTRVQGRPKTTALHKDSRVGQSWVEDVVSVVISVPPDRRRHVVGTHGATLLQVRKAYPSVRVSVPPPSDRSGEVTLKGLRSEVRAAAQVIISHLEVIEAEVRRAAAQKRAEVAEELLQVAPSMRRLVVGQGGAWLRRLTQEHPGVTVMVPPPTDTTTHTVSIRGPPARVTAAMSAIKARLARSQGRKVPPLEDTEASGQGATRVIGTLRTPSVTDGSVQQG